WHGGWMWQKVERELTAAGLPLQMVELPRVAPADEPRFGLHDDADFIRRRIRNIDGPTVVVAHSYGAASACEGAADLLNVRHMLFLAGFQLDVGESMLSVRGGVPPEWWNIDGDIITPDRPREVFYGDLTAAESAWAIAQLRPLSMAAVTEPLKAAA